MSKHGTLKDYEGNKIYPNAYYKVGDIFITTNEENPADRFGGTWEKLPDETFLMTSSSNYAVKSTGGENEHTLTINEIPSHKHTFGIAPQNDNGSYVIPYGGKRFSDTAQAITSDVGGGQPHNNMPKFYAVYIWIRVA